MVTSVRPSTENDALRVRSLGAVTTADDATTTQEPRHEWFAHSRNHDHSAMLAVAMPDGPDQVLPPVGSRRLTAVSAAPSSEYEYRALAERHVVRRRRVSVLRGRSSPDAVPITTRRGRGPFR